MILLHGWINGIIDLKHAKSVFNDLQKNYSIEYSIMGMNGENTCNFFSCKNHQGEGTSKLLHELELLAKNDLDTFGIIYFHNDEDPKHHDMWQVWLIRKGIIERTTDSYLSPLSEKIENI